jgi:hypothetical protein
VSSTAIGLISIGCIFGGALLGSRLQGFLPKHHLAGDSHEIVKLGAGIIATLTALVLGLLISSAKSSFDAMNTDIVQGSAKIILLDRVLAHYGPEAKPVREQLQRALAGGIERVWPAKKTGVPALAAFEAANEMERLEDLLRHLVPRDDAQRQLLARAQQLVGDLSETRWLLIEQAQNPLPLPFLVVLIFWLTIIFASLGLFAPRNATVLTVLFLCSCSVATAIFLVVELNQPLGGFIKVSDAPLRKALEHLSRQ